MEYARGRPGRRGHVHLGHNFSIQIFCSRIFGAGRENRPPLFDLKIVYSYVIEVADSESDLGLHGRALVSEIMVFLRIRVTCIF